MGRGIQASRQFRRAVEVVNGEQDARRQRKFAHGLAGESAKRLYFKITPLAPSFASLRQPIEFPVNSAGELTSAFAATAGGNKRGIAFSPFDLSKRQCNLWENQGHDFCCQRAEPQEQSGMELGTTGQAVHGF